MSSLREDATEGAWPAVYEGTVLPEGPASELYPPEAGEIDFGEFAPIDISGIPDLFDPAAITGDGI